MKKDSRITIAVASDLHAYSKGSSSPSYLNVNLPASPVSQHPISALLELIRTETLRADLLLCPGDLGDKADPVGIAYSWDALGKLSSELQCELFTATAGNHDIDSRMKDNDHNPLHILKGLEPSFPLQDDDLDDRYWSRAYVIKDVANLRLVVLNSSSTHGYGAIEQNHGRIDLQTLEKIAKDLRRLGAKAINILLCHHHPHQHSELSLGEADVMKHGQQLLDLLGNGEVGRWLVIHGHKHHPKIAYAAGGSGSPVVFAAGSLSAILTGQLQSAARNQFYMIDIVPEECERYGLVGSVRAWDWLPGTGWIKANPTSSGLPATFGFGVRHDPQVVALGISKLVLASLDPLPWELILTAVPELRFIIPIDLKSIVGVLEHSCSLKVVWDGSSIVEIGRTL